MPRLARTMAASTTHPLTVYAEAHALLDQGQHGAARQLAMPLWAALTAGKRPPGVPCRYPVDVAALVAHCALLAGDCEQAIAIVDRCRETFDVAPDQDARLSLTASTAHMFLGNCEQAIALGQAAGDNDQGDPVTRITALAYTAAMYSEIGQYGPAAACLQTAQDLLTRFHDPGLYCLVQAVRAKFELEHHDPLEAIRFTEPALPAAARSCSALNRNILYWTHAKALVALGRWEDALNWLAKIDPLTLNYWDEIRIEAVRVNAYVQTGRRQQALQRIDAVLSRRNPAFAAQEYTALLDLLDAAETAGSPAVAARLVEIKDEMPEAFAVNHARLCWVSARNAFRRGLPYADNFARFVRLCEKHRLPGLLGQAATQATGLFIDGLRAGVSSPLYAAVLPELTPTQLEQLAELVTAPSTDPAVREDIFQVLAHHRHSESAIAAAEALRHDSAQPDLQLAAERLLQARHVVAAPDRYTLKLRSFGEFALLQGTEPLGDRFRRRAKDLFVMLMLAHPDPLPRANVQEAFWPQLQPKDASNNLRVVVHNLRHVLASADPASGPLVQLETTAEGMLLLPGAEHVAWDVRELNDLLAVARRCAAAGQFEEAMTAYTHAFSIYRGPFMADAACDAVFAVERNYYAMITQEARLELAALHLDHGDPAEALYIAERAVEAEPLDDMGHQLVMRAHAALGYPHRVAAAYARYEEIMAAEASSSPRDAMAQLYKRLLGAS